MGCERSPIHRCYPTTVWRGSFCLLCFHPGPVRSSLTNLENSDSSVFPILTPNLARTPDLHRTTAPRNLTLKPFRDPSLQVAWLQACATTPGWSMQRKINLLFCLFTPLWCNRKYNWSRNFRFTWNQNGDQQGEIVYKSSPKWVVLASTRAQPLQH